MAERDASENRTRAHILENIPEKYDSEKNTSPPLEAIPKPVLEKTEDDSEPIQSSSLKNIEQTSIPEQLENRQTSLEEKIPTPDSESIHELSADLSSTSDVEAIPEPIIAPSPLRKLHHSISIELPYINVVSSNKSIDIDTEIFPCVDFGIDCHSTDERFPGERKLLYDNPFIKMVHTDAMHFLGKRLWANDLKIRAAYIREIARVGHISEDVKMTALEANDVIKQEWFEHRFVMKHDDKSSDRACERRFYELVGPDVGNSALMGLSRNEELGTTIRMWMRKGIWNIKEHLKILIQICHTKAEEEIDVIMPSYEEGRRYLPVRWSHWLMSHVNFFTQDLNRYSDLEKRLNYSPLGCGTVAGNHHGIDRDRIAAELEFSGVTPNSMYTVGNRDHVAMYLFHSALLGVHISQLCEDLILFGTKEFSFTAMSDSFVSKSKTVSGKKNCSTLEFIRGSTGILIGNYVAFMSVLKGLPTTFNKDLDLDKTTLFSTNDEIIPTIEVLKLVISRLTVNPLTCSQALNPEMLFNNINIYLIKKGLEPNTIEEVTTRIRHFTRKKKCSLLALTPEDLMNLSKHITADIKDFLTYESGIELYQSPGGTSRKGVLDQIVENQKQIEVHHNLEHSNFLSSMEI